MRKKLKAFFAAMVMICMVASFMYGPVYVKAEEEKCNVEIVLDDLSSGQYDDGYKSSYGKIEYSIDGNTYYDITDSTELSWVSSMNGDKVNYTTSVNKGNTLYIKCSPVTGKRADSPNIGEGNIITINAISSDVYGINIGFVDENVENNDEQHEPSSTQNAISFRVEGNALDAAKIEYSIDSGNTWSEITSNITLDESVNAAKVKVTYNSENIMVQGNISENFVVENEKEYELTEKKEYLIQVDKLVRTVTWAYDDTFGEDGKVEHGKVEIISAIAKGETMEWSGIEEGLPGENNNKQDSNGGRVAIIPGSTVTVKIIPDYGYQFVNGSLNGIAIKADDNQTSTFTFIMPEANLHLSALLTKSNDKVNISSTGIDAASISEGEGAISSGNLNLNITDLEPSSSIKEGMEKVADKATIEKYLNIDLSNIVNKGNDKDVWETVLTDLAAPIKISLSLEKDLQDSESIYSIIREHNGEYTIIPATYNSETGVLSFETDKFSEYAIAKIKSDNQTKYPIINGENGSYNADSGDYVVRIDCDYTKFVDLYIDGKLIDKDNYTVKSGSTIITLKADYIKTLSVGKHTIRANFTDGYAETNVTINESNDKNDNLNNKTSNKESKVKTSDNTLFFIWTGLLFASLIGLILSSKKEKISSR